MWWLLREDKEDHVSGSILMEDQIWSALPHGILFNILGRLPFDSVLRFRSVSKQWNALLRNPSCSPFFNSPAAFYNKPCAIFISTQTTLRPSSFVQQENLDIHPFPRRDQMRLSWHRLQLELFPLFHYLVSSHGGLLLIRTRRHTQYLVCNPLLRVWTELPQLPLQSGFSALRAVFKMNPTSTSFKVIWAQLFPPAIPRGESAPSYLYDSSIGEWKPIAERPLLSTYVFNPWNGALCKNICYWSTFSLSLCAFDFERETWLILETKRVPESMLPKYCTLWEWQDHLMMLAQDNMRISIWILSEDNRWNEFDTLTQATQDTIANGFLPFHFTSMGNILLFHSTTLKKVLAYNFVSKDLMISDNSSLCFQSFVSFNPSLQPHWS